MNVIYQMCFTLQQILSCWWNWPARPPDEVWNKMRIAEDVGLQQILVDFKLLAWHVYEQGRGLVEMRLVENHLSCQQWYIPQILSQNPGLYHLPSSQPNGSYHPTLMIIATKVFCKPLCISFPMAFVLGFRPIQMNLKNTQLGRWIRLDFWTEKNSIQCSFFLFLFSYLPESSWESLLTFIWFRRRLQYEKFLQLWSS